MKSLISDEKACFFCGNPETVEHHVFRGSNRDNSTQYGCVIRLCVLHHTHSQVGVHWTDPKYHLIGEEHDLQLKTMFQEAWEKRFGSREDFISVFGRSWI